MSALSPSLFLIEDEAPIRHFLHTTLTNHGYTVREAVTALAGIQQIALDAPNLVLLDLGLPDLDGLEVIQRLREWTELPIIVLSARGQEHDKVAALNGGADDYLTKPFGVDELLARVAVALRHVGRAVAIEEPVVQIGPIRVDRVAHSVTVYGEEVHLTPIEYSLLQVLVRHAGKVVTHRQLLQEVWGAAYANATHYLRVYMGQLRQKLETEPARPRYLLTEPGIGYRLRVA
jgi:two-component system KDP operon response regulator KdpE